MKQSLRYEMHYLLRCRAVGVVVLSAVVLSGLGGLIYSAVSRAMLETGSTVTLSQALSAAAVKGSAAPILAGVLGALFVGRTYRYGTLQVMLWLVPDRRVLFRAKMSAVALICYAVGVLGLLAAWGSALLFAQDLEAGSMSELVPVAVFHPLVSVMFGMGGGVVSIMSRSQSIAVAAAAMYPLIAEPVLSSALRLTGGWLANVGSWLPTQLMQRTQVWEAAHPILDTGQGHVLPVELALAAITVLGLIILAGGARVFAAQDA